MQSSQKCPRAKSAAAVAIAAALAGLVAYGLTGRAGVYAATGDSYPGALTAAALPVGQFIATLCGAVCLGGLLYVVTTARPDIAGVIDERAFRVHLLIERAAAVWAATALIMVAVSAASAAGADVTRLVLRGSLIPAIVASETSRAWVVVAAAAFLVAVTVRFSVKWITHVVLLVPAVVAVVAVTVSGNAGQGPDHDYATSTAIVFAVALAALAGFKVAAVTGPPASEVARRVLLLETLSGAVAFGYGAILLALLAGSGLLHTGYGRVGLVAGTVLLAVWLGDVITVWRRDKSPYRGKAAIDAVALIAVLALLAVMATQPAPRLLAHRFTAWDVFLGYQLPDPPSVLTLLTVWRFDTFIGVGTIVLAGLYLAGYLRLRRRGDDWPAGRLAAWLAGCAVLVFTVSSGVRAYGSAMFSVHMAEHMTLNMFIPVLLVLGGPVTLALRALPAAGDSRPPGPREWLLWLVHSKVTAFLANPMIAFILFVASLYIVYFTPIFNTLARYHWGHELMSLHFLLVGYLFYWGIIGIDPGPRKLPFLGRLGLLFAVMPFHAFFGIATMTMTSVMGGPFYRSVALPWLASIEDDQHLGGAIAWGSSELPVIIVVIALVAQWARQDRRAASRSDRHADSSYADDELDAYNAMLRELSRDRH
ncbi:cytochrome c oxidase assembly protein [Mycobacterium sp. 155]|uniref:cytochrome c oxidase assembly protein n=1 Tax=Mycobacterium sp. 155 TaxID=1157943 RepID=UPI00035F2614|nr:cytochrome c oxidase assembly protein [Mycobacterium sp. 155]